MGEPVLNEAYVEAIAKQVAECVSKNIARELMTQLGVDASNPMEMQKDFQHLRAWRLSMESVRSKSILTIVSIAVTGLAALIWMALTKQF